MRIGGPGRHGRAIKVWEQREFRDLDGERELGTRNIKVALRRLRRFAREGAADELDMDATIDGTARQGWLDVHMRPERHNAVKLLLFLDIGGSMDGHVKVAEELFSACRTEFKHLEHYYFHNCIYEGVWKDNRRRHVEKIPTLDILHKFGRDHKLVIVGDAAMSPYEITHAGGSIEHYNEEAGRGVAQAADRHLSERGVDQPDARSLLGPLGLDRDHQAADGRAHVHADPRRPGPGDARVEPQALRRAPDLVARRRDRLLQALHFVAGIFIALVPLA